MAEVRIFSPAKNAMQSGMANSRHWVVEFEPVDRKVPDPLMGWNGSRDTLSQLRLRFDTREEAVAFAERRRRAYTVEPERPVRQVKAKSYADNFRFDRLS